MLTKEETQEKFECMFLKIGVADLEYSLWKDELDRELFVCYYPYKDILKALEMNSSYLNLSKDSRELFIDPKLIYSGYVLKNPIPFLELLEGFNNTPVVKKHIDFLLENIDLLSSDCQYIFYKFIVEQTDREHLDVESMSKEVIERLFTNGLLSERTNIKSMIYYQVVNVDIIKYVDLDMLLSMLGFINTYKDMSEFKSLFNKNLPLVLNKLENKGISNDNIAKVKDLERYLILNNISDCKKTLLELVKKQDPFSYEKYFD